MNREQQDLNWRCLPKESREGIKAYHRENKAFSNKSSMCNSVAIAVENIFGHHNLTSGTEPEEMLHCSRKFVIGRYKHLTSSIAWNEGDARAFKAETSLLKDLFGDKCLPDTPNSSNLSNIGKYALEHGLEQSVQASVQVKSKPKFKVGELAMNYGRVCRVLEYNANNEFPYLIHTLYNNNKTVVHESDLEPYTEEKETMEEEEIYDRYFPPKNSQLKDNMEEKELNLCELLKSCEGMEVYSLLEGIAFIRNVGNALITTMENNNYGEKGNVYVRGECLLYPSKELYMKYPLDAYSAWMEWQVEKKSK